MQLRECLKEQKQTSAPNGKVETLADMESQIK